ncbi:hypothetical protein [Clostridium estertheticum]|uniref:hypothetical protein n=1 Tax=Clostridium estertheticum TaxID=238834 RepID=UPI00124EBE0C|nr:hypothetical protein [Clostridium estertheticum]MBZ9616772.1 hypothetical protein [Clostridium estertheticum subsp. laramiense]WAG72479.1 hypothetical protein LL032_15140 [Clostridium estertheticum]
MTLGKNTERIQITLNSDKHHDKVILNFLESCYDSNGKIKEILYNTIVSQGQTQVQAVTNSEERLLTISNYEKQEVTVTKGEQEDEMVSKGKKEEVIKSNSNINFDNFITEEGIETKDKSGFNLNSLMDSMNQFIP